jgi:hypothetical protein
MAHNAGTVTEGLTALASGRRRELLAAAAKLVAFAGLAVLVVKQPDLTREWVTHALQFVERHEW